MTFSPDSRLFTARLQQGVLTIYDADTGAQRSLLKLGAVALSFRDVVFSPDGTRIIAGISILPFTVGSSTPPTVWDVASGNLLLRLEGHPTSALHCAFSPDGKRIATVGRGRVKPGEVKLWDAATGRELLSLATDRAPGLTPRLSFSADRHSLTLKTSPTHASVSWDATPRAERK